MERPSHWFSGAASSFPLPDTDARLHPRPLRSGSARSAHRLYVHLVWPTLARLPLIRSDAAPVVEGHLIALCRRLDAEPVCVCARPDRVHALLRLKPGHAVGALVERLKIGSEDWLTAAGRGIRWGHGYAVRSVGSAELRRTMRRIVRIAERPHPRAGR